MVQGGRDGCVAVAVACLDGARGARVARVVITPQLHDAALSGFELRSTA
jgi:hypothetical protein